MATFFVGTVLYILVAFVVIIMAIQNRGSNSEDQFESIYPLRNEQRLVEKSIDKHMKLVYKLQQLKIISQQEFLKKQYKNLTRCWANLEEKRKAEAALIYTQNNARTDSSQQKIIDELQQKIKEQESRINNQEIELNSRQEKIELLEVTIKGGKTAEIARLTNELGNQKRENNRLEYEKNTLQQRNAELQSNVERKDNAYSELNTRYAQQLTEIQNLHSNNTQLSSELGICQRNVNNQHVPSLNPISINDRFGPVQTTQAPTESSCPAFGDYSGSHFVEVNSGKSFEIPCNSDANKVVWSVIERRLNQTLEFNRGWQDYSEGFGRFDGEFFIGLEKLHLMTVSQPHTLLIRLKSRGVVKIAQYDRFVVAGNEENYALRSLGNYTGDAGDGMRENEGQQFSTVDRDNDLFETKNCARDSKGGWWFTDCGPTNLNYKYHSRFRRMMLWNNFKDVVESIELMIRPSMGE